MPTRTANRAKRQIEWPVPYVRSAITRSTTTPNLPTPSKMLEFTTQTRRAAGTFTMDKMPEGALTAGQGRQGPFFLRQLRVVGGQKAPFILSMKGAYHLVERSIART